MRILDDINSINEDDEIKGDIMHEANKRKENKLKMIKQQQKEMARNFKVYHVSSPKPTLNRPFTKLNKTCRAQNDRKVNNITKMIINNTSLEFRSMF